MLDERDHARNGLLCGWAIVVSALILNGASFLHFKPSPLYVLGALCCLAAIAGAYLGEIARAFKLRLNRTLAIAQFALVALAPLVAWALWATASLGGR